MKEQRPAMSQQMSERQMIEACQQGDREAFRQLFELHQQRVWSIARHFTGDEAQARDITQQVFLKLFTSIAQFRHDASFNTWLYRLVVNQCLDEQRRHRRFLSFDFFRRDDDDDFEVMNLMNQHATPPAQEERLSQLQLSGAIKAAVMELNPKLRIAILLKYFEELSYEEIAEALGCSMGTVASRLNRGHKALAQKLAHLRTQL